MPESLFYASLECAYRTRLLSRGTHVGRRMRMTLYQRELLLKEVTVDLRVLERLSWEIAPECYLP